MRSFTSQSEPWSEDCGLRTEVSGSGSSWSTAVALRLTAHEDAAVFCCAAVVSVRLLGKHCQKPRQRQDGSCGRDTTGVRESASEHLLGLASYASDEQRHTANLRLVKSRTFGTQEGASSLASPVAE
jgi:hypothetical protein